MPYVGTSAPPRGTSTAVPIPPPPPVNREAEAMERIAGAAETFANAFSRLVDIIAKLPAPGQGIYRKG
jgi:hypothetical protein